MLPIMAALCCSVAGTIGLWMIDLAVLRGSGDLCNGFFCVGVSQVYHVSLYVLFAALWALAVLVLYVRWKRSGRRWS